MVTCRSVLLVATLLAIGFILESVVSMSLPPGMNIFGPQVDQTKFQHELKRADGKRACTHFSAPLLRWLKEYNSQINGVEIGHSKRKGCGIFAKEKIKEGTHMALIPARIAWSKEVTKSADLGKVFDRANLLEQMILFGAVQRRKGNSSMWYPYLESTPTLNEMTNVMFWTEEEKKQLEGSHLVDYVVETMKEVDQIYTNGAMKCPKIKKMNVTLDDVMWAWGMINSRQVTFGDRALQAVVPFIDLVNCAEAEGLSNVNVQSVVMNAQNYIAMTATRDIDEKEEILIPFPNRENSYLAHRLGFAIDSNPNENSTFYYPTYFKEFSWSEDHQESEVRKELYKYLKLEQGGKEWSFSPASGPSFDLLNAARARSIRIDEVPEAGKVLPRQKMLSIESEVRAYNQILNITQEKEKKYVSSVETDQKLLASSSSLSVRERIAVQVRLAEKMVLKQTLDKIISEVDAMKKSKKKKSSESKKAEL